MKPITTLLVTGANNHDWQRSAPFFERLLNDSGKFATAVAADASTALEGDLQPYQLFFLDYNGPAWSEKAQLNFLDAVWNGAGVVVVHAANNAFPGWVEYEKMIGLLWRDAEDRSNGSGHGDFHCFEVRVTAPEHPIVQGLSNFAVEDELYHRLKPMHGTAVQVLAEAYSAPEYHGTGCYEPILMVSEYGNGRVFHTALGHVWPGDPDGEYRGATLVALNNEGFQQTLLRGCQWAAGEKVGEDRL